MHGTELCLPAIPSAFLKYILPVSRPGQTQDLDTRRVSIVNPALQSGIWEWTWIREAKCRF